MNHLEDKYPHVVGRNFAEEQEIASKYESYKKLNRNSNIAVLQFANNPENQQNILSLALNFWKEYYDVHLDPGSYYTLMIDKKGKEIKSDLDKIFVDFITDDNLMCYLLNMNGHLLHFNKEQGWNFSHKFLVWDLITIFEQKEKLSMKVYEDAVKIIEETEKFEKATNKELKQSYDKAKILFPKEKRDEIDLYFGKNFSYTFKEFHQYRKYMGDEGISNNLAFYKKIGQEILFFHKKVLELL